MLLIKIQGDYSTWLVFKTQLLAESRGSTPLLPSRPWGIHLLGPLCRLKRQKLSLVEKLQFSTLELEIEHTVQIGTETHTKKIPTVTLSSATGFSIVIL